jgi:hypothetical protein
LNDTGKPEDGSDIRFSFRDHLETIGYFLLHRQAYEGADYVLVHARTGRRFFLQDVPVVSPDRSRIVTASAGLSGGYAANAVQIWELRTDGPRLEFDLRPEDWEPSAVEWLDDRTIRLKKQAPLRGENRAFSTSVLLKRELARGWVLRSAAPFASSRSSRFGTNESERRPLGLPLRRAPHGGRNLFRFENLGGVDAGGLPRG